MPSTLKQRITDLIGAPRRIRLRQVNSSAPTRDFTTADYRYWDKARRAKARGLEISGLLLKPLASKTAAWTLGASLTWEAGASTDALNAWWARHHPHIVRAYEEALNLGDCYLVVNADLSLTVIPPHVVEPLLDADGNVAGWRITESADLTPAERSSAFPSPLRREGSHTEISQHGGVITTVDEYTYAERVRRTMRGGVSIKTEKYANLLGLLPVIHVANRTGSDEFYGRPEGDALIPALQRYGDLLDAAIRGNIRQGRPTPVIERMGTAEQVRKFWEQFGRRETNTLPDGTTESVDVIDFDPDQLLTLGGEAQFRYAAPGSFSTDTQNLLGILFYLVLQHSEIPEAVWGASIPSSRASADTQMQPFIQWIEKKRGLAAGWLHELARVVLATMALTDWRIDDAVRLNIQWTPLTDEDKRLRLDTVTWAHGAGVLNDAEARQELGLKA